MDLRARGAVGASFAAASFDISKRGVRRTPALGGENLGRGNFLGGWNKMEHADLITNPSQKQSETTRRDQPACAGASPSGNAEMSFIPNGKGVVGDELEPKLGAGDANRQLAPLTRQDYYPPRTKSKARQDNKFPRSSLSRASDIADMVPMVALLRELGFQVHERTHRCPCVLHGGRNPSAFSWTESGQWFCHTCGIGGDRIELVKRVRGYGFREAIQFLAGLAGVDISDDPVTRKEIQKQKRERQRIETKEKKLAALECVMRGRYREEIVDLEEIRKKQASDCTT